MVQRRSRTRTAVTSLSTRTSRSLVQGHRLSSLLRLCHDLRFSFSKYPLRNISLYTFLPHFHTHTLAHAFIGWHRRVDPLTVSISPSLDKKLLPCRVEYVTPFFGLVLVTISWRWEGVIFGGFASFLDERRMQWDIWGTESLLHVGLLLRYLVVVSPSV